MSFTLCYHFLSITEPLFEQPKEISNCDEVLLGLDRTFQK